MQNSNKNDIRPLWSSWSQLRTRATPTSIREHMRQIWLTNYQQQQQQQQQPFEYANSPSRFYKDAWTLWRLFCYFYLSIIIVRCLVYCVSVQSGWPLSLATYRRLDPFLPFYLSIIARHHYFSLCVALLSATTMHIDYYINVVRLPVELAQLFHELLVEMAESQDSGSYSILCVSSSFPNLSGRLRAKAGRWLALLDRADRLMNILIFFLPTIVACTTLFLLFSSREVLAINLLHCVRICGPDVFAFFFIEILWTTRIVLFYQFTLGAWMLVAGAHVRECTAALRSAVLAPELNPLRFTRALAHFRAEHSRIVRQLIWINHRLASRFLFCGLCVTVPLSIQQIANHVFMRLPLPSQLTIYFSVGQLFAIICAQFRFLIWAMSSVYGAGVWLGYRTQVRMQNRALVRDKLKAAQYYEILHTRVRQPICFTYGHLGEVTKKWIFDFFFLYSTFLVFVFKIFIKSKLQANSIK